MSKNEAESVTQDELTETVKNATSQALQDSNLFTEGGEDYEDDDYEEEEDEGSEGPLFTSKPRLRSVEDIKRQIDDADEFDIFADVGDELAKSGLFVQYIINKGGKHFTTEEHPYSWEKLQKERGGGHYKVIAKDQNKKYIKTQTKTLAEVPNDKAGANGSGGGDKPLSTMEIFAMLKQGSQEAKDEARREASEQRTQFQEMMTALKPDNSGSDRLLEVMANNSKENLTLITTMMTAMKPEAPKDNSSEMTKMMFDLNKSQTEMMMKMQENTMAVIKEMNEKQERNLEVLRGSLQVETPEPEFSAVTVMQLTAQAEEKGAQRVKDLYDLVDLKAAEKAEFMTDKEPESTTDLLLKNFLPILGQVAAAKATAVPTPQQRRPVRPTPAQIAQHNQKRSESAKRTAEEAKRKAAGTRNGNAHRPIAEKSASILDQIEEIEQNPENGKIVVDVQNRDKIVTLMAPMLLQAVNEGKGLDDIPEIVDTSLRGLHEQGIDVFTIERDVSPETIDQMIVEYSLPDDFSKLLREYYAELIKRTVEIRKAANDQKAEVS